MLPTSAEPPYDMKGSVMPVKRHEPEDHRPRSRKIWTARMNVRPAATGACGKVSLTAECEIPNPTAINNPYRAMIAHRCLRSPVLRQLRRNMKSVAGIGNQVGSDPTLVPLPIKNSRYPGRRGPCDDLKAFVLDSSRNGSSQAVIRFV